MVAVAVFVVGLVVTVVDVSISVSVVVVGVIEIVVDVSVTVSVYQRQSLFIT